LAPSALYLLVAAKDNQPVAPDGARLQEKEKKENHTPKHPPMISPVLKMPPEKGVNIFRFFSNEVFYVTPNKKEVARA